MAKSGWWSVKVEATLDGESVLYSDLSETTKEHIAELIKEGYYCGEIIEESDDE